MSRNQDNLSVKDLEARTQRKRGEVFNIPYIVQKNREVQEVLALTRCRCPTVGGACVTRPLWAWSRRDGTWGPAGGGAADAPPSPGSSQRRQRRRWQQARIREAPRGHEGEEGRWRDRAGGGARSRSFEPECGTYAGASGGFRVRVRVGARARPGAQAGAAAGQTDHRAGRRAGAAADYRR